MLEHVAVIVPVYNGALWLDECFQSIIGQTVLSNTDVRTMVSVYNDASTDESAAIIDSWKSKFLLTNVNLVVRENFDRPKGVGYARNEAIKGVRMQKQYEIDYFCFLDCDDVMMPGRVENQLQLCREFKDAIVGCQVMNRLQSLVVYSCFDTLGGRSTGRRFKWTTLNFVSTGRQMLAFSMFTKHWNFNHFIHNVTSIHND